MKAALRFSVGCLIGVLAMQTLLCIGQSLAPGVLGGRDEPWLQVNCHNPRNSTMLNPQWTVIVTAIKPTIRQLGKNRWEISFPK